MTSFRQPLFLVGALVALAGVTTGCGARTGLELPDATALNQLDAGVPDASMDAAVDASTDGAVDAEVPCIDVPFDGGPVEVSLSTQAEIGRADVVFVVDATASMRDEIDTIRSRLQNQLAPAIRDAIPDSQIGVVSFQDFPVDGYGDPRAGDLPFRLMTPVTVDVAQVQSAVGRIAVGDGVDPPESQVEALYQLATGEGFPRFVDPSPGCPSGGNGYACLRTDALPVALLFTDAEFHNGPRGTNRYDTRDFTTPPHDYTDMVAAVDRLGMRVIGFGSGMGDRGDLRDMRELARDTGALDRDGQPLVFDIGTQGERLGTNVVNAIRTFASDAVFDVDVRLRDPLPGDGVDVTAFVDRVVPLRAEPPDGVGFIDTAAGVFRDVQAGTRVVYQLVLRNDAVVPGPEPQSFKLTIVFRADGRATVAVRTVELIIPGADGTGCPMMVVDGG